MDKNIQKNILVTGAAGFIGSNFVHFTLNNDPTINIVSLDKLTYASNKENLANLPNASKHVFIHGDICDRTLLDKVLRKHHISIIVHFAAESHVDRSILDPTVFIQTNVVGTFTLLEAAYQYWLKEKKLDKTQCHFHHISTDEVYGELGTNETPFTENSPYLPSSPYAASKASSDHLVRAYGRTYKLPITISNCSNNYGPKQHAEKLIPTVIRSCLEQQEIPLYGNGLNLRDWLYVDDHCQAIWTILDKGIIGETYNIGGNTERDNLSLVKTICTIINKKISVSKPLEQLITFVEDRAGHDWRYALNIEKISSTLGWQPKTTLNQGLQLTVEYYLKQTRYGYALYNKNA